MTVVVNGVETTMSSLVLAAGSALIPSTTPATMNQEETVTNKINYIYIEYSKVGTTNILWVTEMPENWDGGNMTMIVNWTAISVNAGVAKYDMAGYRFADNIDLDTALASVSTVTDTFLGTGKFHKSDETAPFAITGTGNFIVWQLSRDNAVGSNLDDPVRVASVKLTYYTNTRVWLT